MWKLLIEQENWLKENNLTLTDCKVLDVAETEELKKKWKASFIPNLKNNKILHKCPICSKDDKRSYNWHAFSLNFAEAEEVHKYFLKEKLRYHKNDLNLIWEECNSNGLVISSKIVKNCKWTNTDIYVFDNTFVWTFIVTHEGWFYYKEI